MTIVTETPPCAREPGVYHDEDLLSPRPRRDMSAAQWRRSEALKDTARRQCAACPLMIDCLYRAVVEVDVAGFVACTTEPERQRIRRELGIAVTPTTAGTPRSGGGPIDHATVLATRHANPNDTCQQLADRLECSVSTIKRHLRRARQGVPAAPPGSATAAPSVDQVLDCFDRLESTQVA